MRTVELGVVERTIDGDAKPFEVARLDAWRAHPRYRAVIAANRDEFHGRPTANGETYNMYAMSAAHKTLPLPSFVRVRNPANGREVIVRVNDRGPFARGRVIDLSYTAALKLDLLRDMENAPIADQTELRLRGGDAQTLKFDWLELASERAIEGFEVPRADYDEIVADAEEWADLRARFDGALLVDWRRLMFADATA